jgi:hypothetical protein
MVVGTPVGLAPEAGFIPEVKEASDQNIFLSAIPPLNRRWRHAGVIGAMTEVARRPGPL